MANFYQNIIGKPAIIIDIGHAYTKCGFAGETGPHSIIPTKVAKFNHLFKTNNPISICNYKDYIKNSNDQSDAKHEEILKEILIEFLYKIYYKIFNLNSKEKQVVIVESILTPIDFRKVLADVLFNTFQAVSVMFIPAHVATMYTLGVSKALVIDCGYMDIQVMPIAEGIPMTGLLDFANLGAKRLHSEIESNIRKFCQVTIGTSRLPFEEVKPAIELSDEILEDIKLRCCFVTSFERSRAYRSEIQSKNLEIGSSDTDFKMAPDCDYNLYNNMILHIPGYVREMTLDVLFTDLVDTNQTVQHLIIDTILKCPIDLRRDLAQNIVIIGGTAMQPGFKHRLVCELNHLINNDDLYSNKFAFKELKFHAPPSQDNYTAWLGASIFGSLEALDSNSVFNIKYKDTNKIPDWFTINPKPDTHLHQI